MFLVSIFWCRRRRPLVRLAELRYRCELAGKRDSGRAAASDSRAALNERMAESLAELADLPQPTSGAGASVLPDGSVIVIGGEDPDQSSIVSQFARLSKPGQWTASETMLIARHGFQLALFKGRAWACGGGAGLRPVTTCTSIR